METRKVSIVVPVYRTEAFLPRCLDSLRGQRYPGLEILLVDDGSPDRCGEICEDYARRDPRFVVIHQENRGVGAARSRGLEEATGDFITFCDSDDWAENTWIETLLRPFEDDPDLDVSICGWFRHEGDEIRRCGDGLPRERIDGREAFRIAVRGSGFDGYLWNKLFRTERLHGLCFREDLPICEDLLFCCEAFLRCGSVSCTGMPLYHYAVREGSASRSLSVRLQGEAEAWDALLDLAGDDEDLADSVRFSCVQQLNLLSARARKAGFEEEANALKRRLGEHVSRALLTRRVDLRARGKLAFKLLFPGLIPRKYF